MHIRSSSTRLKSLAFVAVLVATAMANAIEPPDYFAHREFFVDDHFIDSLDGVELRLHAPIPREVALVTDAPCEGNTCTYFTVFADEDRFRMYYRGSNFDESRSVVSHPEVICYAESTDGISWSKPTLGIHEFDGSTDNNIVITGLGTHNFAPFRDANPHCPADTKYKAIASGRGGLYAFGSADAIHWKLLADKPVITEGAFDSQNLAFWDPNRQQYVDYHRDFRDGVRDIKTCVSDDFLTWSDPDWLDYGGTPPEHLYTNAITPYFRGPHLLVGFPKRLLPSRQGVKHHYPGVSDGVFMTSRDGVHFHRWQTAFLRPGQQPDRWVNRNNMIAWGILATESNEPGVGKELSIYATEGYYRGDDVRLRRHTIRLDGFCSVHANADGGTLTTKPFSFTAPASSGDLHRGRQAWWLDLVKSEKPISGTASLDLTTPHLLVVPQTRNLGTAFTLAAHMRAVPAGHRRLFSSYDGGSTRPGELYFDFDANGQRGLDGAAIRFEFDGQAVTAPAGDTVGDWSRGADPDAVHHLAVTYQDGDVKLYHDGRQVAEGSLDLEGGVVSRRGDLRFGEDYPPTSLTNERLQGFVDNVVVVQESLSADAIKQLASDGPGDLIETRLEGVIYTFDDTDRPIQNVLADDGSEETELRGLVAGPIEGVVELTINYATSAAGSIRCEVQDEAGNPIPGYTFAECDEIYGDHIELAVTWNRSSEIKPLAGREIRLIFELKDADLYSLIVK